MKKMMILLMGGIISGCAHTGKDRSGASSFEDALAFAPLESTQENQPIPVSVEELDQLMSFNYSMPEVEERFDISAVAMPARKFFMSLVSGTGENLVLPKKLSGTISLTLKNVTIEEALNAVADVYGYDFEKNDYGYRIITGDLQTRMFKVDYLAVAREGKSHSQVHAGDMSQPPAISDGKRPDNHRYATGNVDIQTVNRSDFWAELEQGLGQIIEAKPGRNVSLSPQSGVVVVTASLRELRQIKQLLEAMEANVSRQVMLEAKILEVTLSEGFQSGINWSGLALNSSGNGFFANQIGGGSVLNGVGSGVRGNAGQVGPSGNAFPSLNDVAAFGGVFNLGFQGNDFGGFIELLKQQGDVQVLSSPRVSTLNNQKAVIKVGTDEFFVTDIATTTTSTSGATTTSPSVSLTPFFSGIALDVTPQVSDNGIITLHVHPTISEVSETNKLLPLGNGSQTVPLATANVRESDSVIRAKSGQVVVIGGLMQSVTDNQRAGIPGLSDVPVVGGAFGQRRNSELKKELVILLRPVVVENGDWTGVSQTLGMQDW